MVRPGPELNLRNVVQLKCCDLVTGIPFCSHPVAVSSPVPVVSSGLNGLVVPSEAARVVVMVIADSLGHFCLNLVIQGYFINITLNSQ